MLLSGRVGDVEIHLKGVAAALATVALPILTRLDPELAHDLGLAGLKSMRPFWPTPSFPAKLAVRCFGLGFAHPIGLAAGFDKNGDYLDALGALGFSHIELGTVTPRPQSGNPKPRLFRLAAAHALVNRMGFNNKGVDHLVRMLARSHYRGIRGISIGRNFDTPNDEAQGDYVHCLRKVYPYADYVAVNTSSPNTAHLRELQEPDSLQRIVGALVEARQGLAGRFGKHVPLLLKIAPDLNAEQIAGIVQLLRVLEVDGVIATNTTSNLQEFAHELPPNQQGGLSGAPLHRLSIGVIAQLRSALGPDYPIIGVGGILSADSARQTLQAGANLLQIYTGFVLQGPPLVEEILAALAAEPR
jgi:dihydroorotate dehydrogenase